MMSESQLRPSGSLYSPATTESEFDSSSAILKILPREAFVGVVTYMMQIHAEKHEWRHGRRRSLAYLRQPLTLIKNDWLAYLKSMREVDRRRLKKRIEAVNKIQKDIESRLVFYETTDTELIEPEGFMVLKQIVDNFAEGVASIMASTQPEPEHWQIDKTTPLLTAAAPISVEDRRLLEALPSSRGDGNFVNGQIQTFVKSILTD